MQKKSSLFPIFLLCVGFLPLAQEEIVFAEASDARVVSVCDAPLMFGFGSWDGAPEKFPADAEGIHLSTENSKGGGGIAGFDLDFSDAQDQTPAITVTATGANQAVFLRLNLEDSDGTMHIYTFDLSGLEKGKTQTITASHGTSLGEPEAIEKEGTTPGFGKLKLWMLIGDWSDRPIDLFVSRIELVSPDDAILSEREKFRVMKAEEAEQARLAAAEQERIKRERIEKGSPHPEDGPEIVHVCAVAPDVLALTIQSRKFAGNQLLPYAAQPGDEIVPVPSDAPRYAVTGGKIVEYQARKVYRTVDRNRDEIGLLSPDGTQIFIPGTSSGAALDEIAVDEPDAYSIRSENDPNYTKSRHPVSVFRKGKPNASSRPLPFLVTISLRLPTPLEEEAVYHIRLIGVNTSLETVDYIHRPRATRSLAVHAIQSGYRPDDPHKCAYVSFWMGRDRFGAGEGCTPEMETFELIDSAGKTAFTGRAIRVKSEGDSESICIHESADYSRATVYRLDFSGFSQPGEYRVFVPTLGTSDPLRIATDVWEKPFQAAMQGIFTQRQGIEFGPPATDYRRPRVFHPDDGVEFYQLDIPVQAGQEGVRGAHLLEQAGSGRLRRVDGVWGGYQDAGDWDTIGHHLSATYQLLGLYDLNREAFLRTKLSLPENETENDLPDILDEALWQMPLWKSLQLPDGGVRGGYGDGWGCYDGETSAMIRYAGIYAVDPETTMHYAGVAARTARVLRHFDKKRAEEYLESALLAWDWCEQHADESDETYRATLAFHPALPTALKHLRALAAVELLTATQHVRFNDAYRQSTEVVLRPQGTPGYADLYLEPYQMEAAFAYARLPENLGDAALKQRIVERIAAYADHAIGMGEKNAFGVLAGGRTDFPLIFACRYFSTPAQGGFAFIYAYELTKEPRYLAAAVQGSNYCLGANPDNLSYCTGIGEHAQHFNFIVDALVTGQQPDKIIGHIPYGQGNEGNAMSRTANGWVQTWLLDFPHATKMTPNWFDWPVYEQYIDFATYPLLNENCFNATSVPAACYWFYLAHRK